ncbi:hypothetical protein [Pseudomonas cremoricolorata]|nr:hypothetical protein [Pseudomonas cremoricolorata]
MAVVSKKVRAQAAQAQRGNGFEWRFLVLGVRPDYRCWGAAALEL